ncbi:SCO family protein [Pedobacter nyackensis]|uniref:SCO family protein n=1 Tax=Pedobacter nyackensis TaxID=475255 RepID=UPI002930B54A|nr:SCO family protein [Pedobacter nyackensis]
MKLKFSFSLSLLSAAVIFLSSCQNEKKLPILGPRAAETVKNPDGSTSIDTVYKTIPAFSFLNQDSVPVTQDTFKDKIYIADFFFTSCTTICPTMHRNMKEIFEKYKDNPEVMYLSHTIDFKYDRPSVLKKYAQKLGVDNGKWQFAFGSKDSVYRIAEKDYLVAVIEDTTAKDGYIHQGWLVLVDKQKRIRGAYDGTDTKQVAQLMKDIPVLLAEDKK